jgi:DNA topoisomerase I
MKSAKIAGLRYVTDRMPGIRRIGPVKAFKYRRPDGKVVRNPAELRRIRELAIPPAWTNVWICPLADAHLQAVGWDARGRKQYRYHPQWRLVRDCTKFDHMVDFGKALPKIRQRVRRDLARHGLPKEKALATIVRLLETTLIRVGNEEYKRQNHSFGLTTLENRHVGIARGKVFFYFRGKSGIKHEISVEDPHLAKIVRRLRDLPGYELFQYIDEKGNIRSIGSSDVNEYLREITGEDCTAKDFRTWAATVLAIESLSASGVCNSKRQAKRHIAHALKGVASRLGNTVAICKKCYVHPVIMEAYVDGTLPSGTMSRPRRRRADALSPTERNLIRFLSRNQRSSNRITSIAA